MARIHPIITLLGRTCRICRERISKRKETVYMKGLTDLSRQYSQIRDSAEEISFKNFPQIKRALDDIKISFSVENRSGSIFRSKPNPSQKRLSSLLGKAIRAVIRDLADHGVPETKKTGSVYDFRLKCDIKITPKGNKKVELSFKIY